MKNSIGNLIKVENGKSFETLEWVLVGHLSTHLQWVLIDMQTLQWVLVGTGRYADPSVGTDRHADPSLGNGGYW